MRTEASPSFGLRWVWLGAALLGAVALAAGIALQLVYPGDFASPYRLAHGPPGALAWVVFGATLAARMPRGGAETGGGGTAPAAGS